MAPVGAKNLVSNFLNYNYKMFVMTGKFELEESLLNEEIGVDVALFDLALRNLVDNAIKYSNPNDAIRIKCSAFSDTVSFIFENNTKNGIEAENNRLGTPFYRGLNNEPGLGLGLSIVDNCVQLMGGKAMFGSENEQFISIITFPVLKQ
jgi:signal transduction histidine kinase